MLYDCTIKQNFKGVGGEGVGGPQKLQDFCNYKDLKISAKTLKMLKLTIHIYTTTFPLNFRKLIFQQGGPVPPPSRIAYVVQTL